MGSNYPSSVAKRVQTETHSSPMMDGSERVSSETSSQSSNTIDVDISTEKVSSKPKKVAMLIVSEGNDIRAQKEADFLLDNNYDITFVARKPSIDRVVKGQDGQHGIVQVPVVNDAASLQAIMRRNKSFFSLYDRFIVWWLVLLFKITEFRVIRAKLPLLEEPTQREKLSMALRSRALVHRARAFSKHSINAFCKFVGFQVLSKLVRHALKVIFFPLLIIYYIVSRPFVLTEIIARKLTDRSKLHWAKLNTSRDFWVWTKALLVIFCATFMRLLKKLLIDLPKKPYNILKSYLTKRVPIIYSQLSYFLYYIETKAETVKLAPEVVHAHDLYMLQASVKSAAASKAKAIYDAHELETDRHKNVNPIIKEAIHRQEVKYGKKAQGVITVSRNIAEILKKNLQRDEVVLVYNSPIYDPDSHAFDRNIRDDIGLGKEVPLIVFVGKMFNIHDHDHRVNNIIEALAYTPGMHMAILGAKSDNAAAQMKEWAARYFVEDRLHLMDPVPYAHLINYISAADLGINPMENKCLNTEYSMPNKVFEMALAGVPVVQSDLKESVEFLQNYGMAVTMNPLDSRDISNAMKEVYENRHTMRPSAETLAEIREKYDWTQQGRKLLNLYERVLS